MSFVLNTTRELIRRQPKLMLLLHESSPYNLVEDLALEVGLKRNMVNANLEGNLVLIRLNVGLNEHAAVAYGSKAQDILGDSTLEDPRRNFFDRIL